MKIMRNLCFALCIVASATIALAQSHLPSGEGDADMQSKIKRTSPFEFRKEFMPFYECLYKHDMKKAFSYIDDTGDKIPEAFIAPWMSFYENIDNNVYLPPRIAASNVVANVNGRQGYFVVAKFLPKSPENVGGFSLDSYDFWYYKNGKWRVIPFVLANVSAKLISNDNVGMDR